MTSKEVVNAAQREVGVKENPPGSNKVKYNTWYYGKEVSGSQYPWCCAFVEWLIYRNAPTLLKKTASCSDLLNWCTNNGLIVSNPMPGDLVFFKFDKTSKAKAQHIGIVKYSQWPANITSIEGNTSVTSNDNGGAVMERTRSKSCIVAFARPKYTDRVSDYNTVKNTVNVVNKPTLKMGSKGDWVKVAQARLFVNGYHIEVDGDFGPNTKNAVIAFQATYGLTKDGVIGPKTWAKLYLS